MYIILTYKGYHFSSFLLPRLPLHIGLQCKLQKVGTVKLGDKERFDKEQIGVKEPFHVIKCQFTS